MPSRLRNVVRRYLSSALAARGRVAVVLCSVLVAACGKTDPALDNDAYVWQRRWTPAVTAAMSDSADLVRTWRVLAADVAPDGKWSDAAPALPALAAAGRPAIMVLRFDGRVDGLRDAEIHARIAALRDSWQRAGIALAGVEIDYDCATSKLPAYTRFLAGLRARLDPSISLSITALPTWLDSPALAALLAIPDESVLQVHAVLSPTRGLFDAKRAQAWLDAYAVQTRKPWRVALPAYGSRVAWDDEGRIAAVESEQPALMPGGRSAELLVTPAEMAAFVSRIEDRRPPGLAGIVWFRLPTRVDARAWSLPTWRAVLARQPLRPALSVSAQAAAGGARDLILANAGDADAALPFAVRLDGACAAADGINGYTLERDGLGIYLRRAQEGLLHAGAQRNIGWIRCEHEPTNLHVQP
ncbi:DUF3142 domain-containing protein [Achromobacter sp. Marseille-Q0513]|nr:DUF3142 domain-containing protein [Achromobacter sp. Marseille-Q0513]